MKFIVPLFVVILPIYFGIFTQGILVSANSTDTQQSASVILQCGDSAKMVDTGESLEMGRGRANGIAWSPDGTRIAITSVTGLWIYTDTFETVHHIEIISLDDLYIREYTAAAWSPDGKYLAAMLTDGSQAQVEIFDGASFVSVVRIPGMLPAPWAMSWSSDSTKLAFRVEADLYNGTRIDIYDIPSGQQISTLPEIDAPLLALSWQPHGSYLAAGSEDHKVHVYNADTGDILTSFDAFYPSAVAWHSSGDFLAFPDGENISIVDSATWHVQSSLQGHTSEITNLVWGVTSLVSASYDSTIRFWDVGAAQSTLIFNIREDSLALSPSGELVVVRDRGALQMLNTNKGTIIRSLHLHVSNFTALDWNSTHNMFAASAVGGRIQVWNASTGNLENSFIAHESPYPTINVVAISPDGHLIASGGADGIVRIHDLTTEQLVGSFPEQNSVVTTVTWSSHGRWLASGDNDGKVYIVDTTTYQQVEVLDEGGINVTDLAWNNTNSLLASGGTDGKIRIWDTTNWDLIATLSSGESPIDAISWSPDGSQIASGNWEGTLYIWQVDTSQLFISDQIYALTGIRDLAWSPRGDTILLLTPNTINIWDVPNQMLIEDFVIEDNRINQLVWSDDGTKFATASGDGRLTITMLCVD